MFYVDNPTGVPVMPPVAAVSSLTTLYFTEGGNGIPPLIRGRTGLILFSPNCWKYSGRQISPRIKTPPTRL